MDPKDIFKMKRRAQDKKSGSKDKNKVVVKRGKEEIFFKKGEPHIRRDGKLIPLSEVSDICL